MHMRPLACATPIPCIGKHLDVPLATVIDAAPSATRMYLQRKRDDTCGTASAKQRPPAANRQATVSARGQDGWHA
jgi:hypothetical protein